MQKEFGKFFAVVASLNFHKLANLTPKKCQRYAVKDDPQEKAGKNGFILEVFLS